MKKFIRLALLAVALAVAAPAAAPAVAPAAMISPGYCDYSNRGGGSLAPDNDIYEIWQLLEASGFGNVYAAPYTGQYYHVHPQSVHIKIQFAATKDGYTRYRSAWFECYREGWSESGRYHDNFEAWG